MAKDKSKLSHSGLLRVEEKLEEEGWKKTSHKVCEKTIEFGISRKNQNFAIGCGYKNWQKFLKREPIKTDGFEIFCKVLNLDPAEVAHKAHKPKTDWGKAPDLKPFYGREEELTNLKKLIVDDRCRLVSIVGFAGIGKTKLALKFARQFEEEEEFEHIIWRQIYDTLPLESLLKELIKIVSDNRETELASTTKGLTEQLLRYLNERRCLLIFDNIESIWHGNSAGGYREEYESFFDSIGSGKHSSCVLSTSRIIFSDFERIEIISDAVKWLRLQRLDTEAGRKICQDTVQKLDCEIQGTEEQWKNLIDHYDGNPLALQFVARHIRTIYGDSLARFLEHNLRVLRGVEQLFDWHFKRLSHDEQTIMYWLALSREGRSIDELKEYLVFDREKKYLPQTLDSLEKKIPIETSGDRWTLHSLLMEYTTERAIEKVCEELISGNLELFNSHPLIQVSAKDYITKKQIELILKPIINRLRERLSKSFGLESQNSLENRLRQILKNVNQTIPGYLGGNLINLMRHASISLRGWDFSRMIICEADLSRDFNINLNLQDVDFAGCKFTRYSFIKNFNWVNAIAFHPQKKLIAVADRINGIKLYRLEDWQLYLDLDQSEETKELAFSPDGNFIVGINGGRTVKVWNTATGEWCTFTNGQQIKSIAFAPDNQTVAIFSRTAIVPTSETDSARSESYTISLWNIQTDECRIIETEGWLIIGIAFHSQKNLLFGMQDSQLSVWNTDTKELLCCHDLKTATTEASIFLEKTDVFDLHPSKEILVTGGFFGEIKLWDVKTGQRLKTFGIIPEGLSVVGLCLVSFSGDGHTIVTVYKNGTIKLWDVKTGECLQTWSSNEEFIYATTFSPQKNILAISYGSKVLKLLNIKTGEWLKSWRFYSNNIDRISASSDGQYLAIHTQDNIIRLLNRNFERLSAWRLNHHVIYMFGANYRVFFSPDCRTLAIFSEDTVIKLFNVRTGQEQKTFKHLPFTVSNLRTPKIKFSPDSNLLGYCSVNSSEIILWDLKTKKKLRSIETKINSEMNPMITRRILFSQNNQYLANLSWSGRSLSSTTSIIQIWNIETGECCYNHDLADVFHLYKFDIMAFHPNDRVLICHDRSKNEILLFNFQTGEFSSALEVHEGEVRGIFFDSEANVCIVSTINTIIEIWKVGTNKPIRLEDHTSDIKGVDFTPNGQILVSYDIDDNIYVWNTKTGKLVRRKRLEMPYEGMNIPDVEGLTDAQIKVLVALGAVEIEKPV